MAARKDQRFGWVPRRCTWELAPGSAAVGGARPADDLLTTVECLDLVGELAGLGTEALTLVVPATSSREDWPMVAAAAADRGMAVRLLTDGLGPAAELAASTVRASVGRVAVRLAGLGSAHDVRHGAGTFERAADCARRLAAAGLAVEVVLTLHPEGLESLEPLYALCRVVGVERLTCRLPRPGLEPGPCLEPESLHGLLAQLARLAALPGPDVRVDDSIGYFGPHERALRGRRDTLDYWTGCAAGTRAVGITFKGEVTGCLSLPRSFVEGSVRNETLTAIWRRPSAFAYNRAAPAQALAGACGRCAYGPICRGGARCMAYALTGGFAFDPMCSHGVGLERASRAMGEAGPEPGSSTIRGASWPASERTKAEQEGGEDRAGSGDGPSGSSRP